MGGADILICNRTADGGFVHANFLGDFTHREGV